MSTVYLDIETNLAHTTIWCAVTRRNGESTVHTTPETLRDELDSALVVVGHNLIGFDLPVLERVWDVVVLPELVEDTLYLSRLYDPSMDGGHSLKAWGQRLNVGPKGDFTDYDGGLSDEMVDYCIQDVALTEAVHEHLTKALENEKFSKDSIDLEHEVGFITAQQERNGFKLDVDYASSLWVNLNCRAREIETELQQVFPPIVTERWSEKTGKQLKDNVEVFNIGSRKQIGERLGSIGVKFTEFTETGQAVVNEKTLEGIDKPEAKLIAEYLLVSKRTSQIDSWLNAVGPDGRVHGRVRTNGAVTGRMTHSGPNMAQVPNTGSLYGAECRRCWTVEDGNVLVGIDASGLELRMLAHYMQDTKYTEELLSGDIHTANMKAAGLTKRDDAKTFIYAFLYGAGPAKIGSIVGGGAKQGQQLIDSFLANTPAIAELKAKVTRITANGDSLPGLDGRRLRVRSQHAALNTLLQGAGAVVMKQALVVLHWLLLENKIPHQFVANVHDEFQIETPEEYGDRVGTLGVLAIQEAGTDFKMRCPLDGAYKIGKSWADTH